MKNILIFGNGPVALHLYITLKKDNNKIGFKVRDSLKSKKFLEELKNNKSIIEGIPQVEMPFSAYGKTNINYIIKENNEILNEWETFILATPCDSYLSIVQDIPFNKLQKLKTIVLISPELGSAYFLKNHLKKLGREDLEVISFSNYFGATNFYKDFSTKIMVNALKGKVYLASTNSNSTELEKWINYLKNMDIEGVACKNPLAAESKNITLFVHSPFLFNDISLNQIFLKDSQKRYVYKLYPEGPITKYSIENMTELYHEIMELYKKMEIENFNLLKFLNESYPVLEESLHSDEILNFQEKTKQEQSYLLYVRYSSILIDPYSVPNSEGEYFNFSKVEYSKIFLNKENKWTIPRRPSEDYSKLNLLFHLSECFNTPNIIMKKCLRKYEEFYNELVGKNDIESLDKNSIIKSRKREAEELYNFILNF